MQVQSSIMRGGIFFFFLQTKTSVKKKGHVQYPLLVWGEIIGWHMDVRTVGIASCWSQAVGDDSERSSMRRPPVIAREKSRNYSYDLLVVLVQPGSFDAKIFFSIFC